MPFADLYDAVQTLDGRISTSWIRAKCIEFSPINSVKEIWSSVFNDEYLRGCYVEGPMDQPVAIPPDGCLIILSRAMCLEKPYGDHWRRFVLTKELMHVFDEADEKASCSNTLEDQVQGFSDPTLGAPQYVAENKAVWRAAGVLCQEARRLQFKQQLGQSEISFDVVAAALQIPVNYVRLLMHDHYEVIIQHLK
jgi:hypothetical protein